MNSVTVNTMRPAQSLLVLTCGSALACAGSARRCGQSGDHSHLSGRGMASRLCACGCESAGGRSAQRTSRSAGTCTASPLQHGVVVGMGTSDWAALKQTSMRANVSGELFDAGERLHEGVRSNEYDDSAECTTNRAAAIEFAEVHLRLGNGDTANLPVPDIGDLKCTRATRG